MRFGATIPQTGSFVDPAVQTYLATEIEALGFDSLWVSDHVVVPAGEPYVPEQIHEPLALLSWLAAQTTTITVGTSVLVVPYRDPLVVAKMLSSIDVLSGGRVVAGVGVGWHKEEFAALSASFDQRGAVTDEYLEVIRNVWETETSSFAGHWKQYEQLRFYPKRAHSRERPIPLLVGGNAPVAVRRAARLGDGWHPINLSPTGLASGLAAYHRACAEEGRLPGSVLLRHMPGGRARHSGRTPLTGTTQEQAFDLRAYERAGLDELMLSLRADSAEELLETLGRFITEVVPRA